MKITEKQSNTSGNSENGESSRQQFEERTQSALDAVCRSEAETYNQFMSNFTYLKPEDVKASHKQELDSDNWKPPQLPALDNLGATAVEKREFLNDILRNTDVENRFHKASEPTEESNTLHEEVLEQGSVTQAYMMRCGENTKGIKVKLGNFVDEDDSYEENDNNGYSPSFSTSEKQGGSVEDTEKLVKEQKAPNNAQNVTDLSMLDTSACQKLSPKGAILKVQKISSSENTRTTTDTDTVAKIIASASVKTENQRKSDENLLDLIGSDDSLSEASDLEYDPNLDLPNPGEIIEEKDTIVRDFVTKLNFTARVATENKKPVSKKKRKKKAAVSTPNSENGDREHLFSPTLQSGESQSTYDEVEAFSLDNDFDYDNVVLSPKYNAEEMAIIQNAMTST